MSLIRVEILNYGQRRQGGNIPVADPVDISNCISFDDGIEVSQDRDGVSGIFVDISISQTFYKEAYEIISNLFYLYNLTAYAEIRVYRRDNIDVNQWNLLGTWKLDFETFQDDDSSCSIGIIKKGLREIIESNYSTVYDIRAYFFNNSFQTTRLPLEGSKSISPFGNNTYQYSTTLNTFAWSYWPQVKIQNNKSDLEIPGVFFAEVKENDYVGIISTANNSFLSNQSDRTLTVTINYNIRARLDRSIIGDGSSTVNYDALDLVYWKSGTTNTEIVRIGGLDVIGSGTVSVDIDPGYELSLQYGFRYTYSADSSNVTLSPNFSSTEFNVHYIASPSDSGISIIPNCATPEQMLNNLLNRITINGDFSSRIEWNNEFDRNQNENKLFIAAESVRLLADPYFHVSLSDFDKFMYMLGYVPVYTDDKTIVYKFYTEQFDDVSDPINLPNDEVANVTLNADISHLYTNVKTGYPEVKYESENGRYSVNGTFEWSTGLLLNTEKTLDLTCNFRSDHIGMELLLFTSEQESTDTDSDNDIFVFSCVYQEGTRRYNLNSNFYYNFPGITNNTLRTYDAFLSPQLIINRWAKYLRISGDAIKYESSTNYRNAQINRGNISLYSDVDLTTYTPLFIPIQCSLDCIYIDELYNPSWYGQIQLNYHGKVIKGYLKSSTRDFSHERINDLVLIVKNINP